MGKRDKDQDPMFDGIVRGANKHHEQKQKEAEALAEANEIARKAAEEGK